VLVSALLASVGCPGASENPALVEHREGPRLQFVIRHLEAGQKETVDSVWSQNDNRDSVAVVIVGGEGMVLSSVNVELGVAERAEGDAYINASLPSHAIPWKVLTNVAVDTLPLLQAARVLFYIRPSQLQEEIGRNRKFVVDSVEVGLWVESVKVRISWPPAHERSWSLGLLWD